MIRNGLMMLYRWQRFVDDRHMMLNWLGRFMMDFRLDFMANKMRGWFGSFMMNRGLVLFKTGFFVSERTRSFMMDGTRCLVMNRLCGFMVNWGSLMMLSLRMRLGFLILFVFLDEHLVELFRDLDGIAMFRLYCLLLVYRLVYLSVLHTMRSIWHGLSVNWLLHHPWVTIHRLRHHVRLWLLNVLRLIGDHCLWLPVHLLWHRLAIHRLGLHILRRSIVICIL